MRTGLAFGLAMLIGLSAGSAGQPPAGDPAPAPRTGKPPWQRQLQGADYAQAAAWEAALPGLQATGKFAEALQAAEALAALRARVQGADHPDAVDARWRAETFRRALRQGEGACKDLIRANGVSHQAKALVARGQYKEAQPLLEEVYAERRRVLGEEHPDTAMALFAVGHNLLALDRSQEVEEKLTRALAVHRRLLGEYHPDTAVSYYGVANVWRDQARYAEAEAYLRRTLAIDAWVLGDEHTDTGSCHNNLGVVLGEQGKYEEAEGHIRKALAIHRRAHGEQHAVTANNYSVLGTNLGSQGRYPEDEAAQRKALSLRREVLGEDHPATATSYNNLAGVLTMQGRVADAEAACRKALAISRRILGEEHRATAAAYATLGHVLREQDRYPAAEECYRKALAIHGKLFGEDHPKTALAHTILAPMLHALGRPDEAEQHYRRALAIRRQALGEDNDDTAAAYCYVAACASANGRHQDAEVGYRQALAGWRKALGEGHLETAEGYAKLASSLNAQGRYAEAEPLWVRAAEVFGAARLRRAATGLDRAALTGAKAPFATLATVLARNGKPVAAWQRYEESLARGTWDDLSARLTRPRDEQVKQQELVRRLDRLDQLVEKVAALPQRTAEQERQLKSLLGQRRQAQDELEAFTQRLEAAYGPAAGQVFARDRVQDALLADTALVGWLDRDAQPGEADPDGEHWAILLRATGAPTWVRLLGTGPGRAWTDADRRLPKDLLQALHERRGDWQELALRLRRQRLEPLAAHLAAGDGRPAVRHLVVLPALALAGLPVEAFAGDYTVSYAPSGTLYAHLRGQPPVASAGLLALGDPVFDVPGATTAPSAAPPGGALVTMVVPNSSAAQAGLRADDVLLRYGSRDVAGMADVVAAVKAGAAGGRVKLTVWRAGQTFERTVPAGKLGVMAAEDPAPRALAERGALDRRLASAARGGDGGWAPLPGTRLEVEALRRLFGGDPAPKVLLDSQASEQELDAAAKSGELAHYRFLHLATHGEVDDRAPLRSALILSRDALPDPGKQLDAGLPVYAGRLTAEEILRQWHLQSELVTLSACQTALGKYARGEGHLGFGQALLLAGSRAVVLSLWKVDDAATALLMERFYQNLLGQRDGLKTGLPKAEALREAQAWLRDLPRDEAVRRTTQLRQGVARGKGRPALPPPAGVPAAPAPAPGAEARPYAHPYYWAAFVLLGDPR